jgi:hypothetical protein
LSLGFPIDLTLFQTPSKFDDHISSGFGVRVDKVRFWVLFLVRKKILSIALFRPFWFEANPGPIRMILGSFEREMHSGSKGTVGGCPSGLGGLKKIRPLSCLFKLAVVALAIYMGHGFTGPPPGRKHPHGYIPLKGADYLEDLGSRVSALLSYGY